MSYPFDIQNYPELPEKVRTYLMKAWMRTQHSGATPVGRPPKYPWNEWMDGKHHAALAGRDFHLTTHAFRGTLRQKAYHSGMSVWTQEYKIDEKGPTGPVQFWVAFRFEPKETSRPVED